MSMRRSDGLMVMSFTRRPRQDRHRCAPTVDAALRLGLGNMLHAVGAGFEFQFE